MVRRILAVGLLALGTARASTGVYFQPVEPQLVVSAARAEPGTPLQVGVLFRVQRGWHVYWRNPGDSGLPTSVRWTVPPGFQVSPLRWPIPRRFEQPGGLVGYGYADAVLLGATLTPPPGWTPDGPFPLRADVGWLACESLCIRGTKALELTLDGKVGPPAVNPALFAEWAPRLPVDVDGDGAPARVSARGRVPADGRPASVKVTIDWRQPPASVEWFPPDDTALDVEAAHSRTSGARTQLTLRARRLAGQELEQSTLESVVAWTDAAGVRHGLRVPIDLDGKET
jgi:thiol:disulfide interchange protein DsbD